MRSALTAICCCLLAALPQFAAAGAREMVARMTLVPLAPGGEPDSAPVYDAAEVPRADFAVLLDNQLSGLDIEDYLELRSGLTSARFAVWLYRFDSGDGGTDGRLPSPTLVIAPDSSGEFPLTAPAIAPGKTYAWQVVATLEDSAGVRIDLWSTLLYFRTSPAEALLPALLSPAAQAAGERLLMLSAAQRRQRDGLAAQLRGLRLYGNYPSASDMFYCTPLLAGATSPMAPNLSSRYLSVSQLLALGRVMARTSELKRGLRQGAVPAAELAGLSEQVYALVNQWPEAAVSPIAPKVSTLAAVAEKLTDTESAGDGDRARATLNELLLAADELAGTGTGTPAGGYEQAFLAYAEATRERLGQLAQIADQLSAALGPEESGAWLAYFDDQDAALDALTDEVGRGRLSKAQLAARIAEQAGKPPPDDPEEPRYLVAGSCRVDLDRIKRLTPEHAEQVERLGAEVVRCHLRRLAEYLWPNAS